MKVRNFHPTLLERFNNARDQYNDWWFTDEDVKQIRFALAVAQAVAEWHNERLDVYKSDHIIWRADDILMENK